MISKLNQLTRDELINLVRDLQIENLSLRNKLMSINRIATNPSRVWGMD